MTEESEEEEKSVVEVTARDGVEDQRKEGGVDGSSAQASAGSGYAPHPLAKELKERSVMPAYLQRELSGKFES